MSTNIFDMLIIISGIYLIYTAIAMKRSGNIAAGVLLSKDIAAGKIRDKEGFINYMFGKVIVLGVLTCMVGIIGYLNTRMNGPASISIAVIVLYLIVLVIFAVAINKARKIYID